MTKKKIDILGLGAVAVDDLLFVGSYPEPETKVPVKSRDRQCGGLTGTALVAASRLGSLCAYAGTLGDDDLSRFVLDVFRREKVDTGSAVIRPEYRPFHSTIIVDTSRRTRTILYTTNGVLGAHPDLPAKDLIRSAKVLFVDHVGADGMIRAARIARSAGIPVVADYERTDIPRLEELLDLADHLIMSRKFAAAIAGRNDPADMVEYFWTTDRDTVAVTDGEHGCWYRTRMEPGSVRHQGAYRVTIVDTTGCGDVFHGAYASVLARGLTAQDRIRFAAAAAALKATRPGGQAGIPDRSTVEKFLKQQGE